MTLIIDPYRFGGGGGTPAWDTFVASLGPQIWLKLDETTRTAVALDASGNARHFAYPNGTFAPSDIPDRGNTPMVTGSTFSITTFGGGNNELLSAATAQAYLKTMLTAGSWTVGAFVSTTVTAGRSWQWGMNDWRVGMSFNFNGSTFSAQNGTLSLWYDNGGANANALVATATGWNDGTVRPLFFEYDSVADTISIWLDGTRIATRARAGTKPTSGNIGGADFLLKDASGISPVNMDEVLFFDKVLSSGDHSAMAAYAV